MVEITNGSKRAKHTFTMKPDIHLYPHQEAELYRMLKMEQPFYMYRDIQITTHFGMLVSPVSSGKSFSLLALIDKTYKDGKVRNNLFTTQNVGEATLTYVPEENKVPFRNTETTVVVCAKYALADWKRNADICGVGHSYMEVDENKPVCFVPVSMLARFATDNNHYRFKRIVLDNADFLRMPTNIYLLNQFVWFVSYDPMNLVFFQGKKRDHPFFYRYLSSVSMGCVPYFSVETNAEFAHEQVATKVVVQGVDYNCASSFAFGEPNYAIQSLINNKSYEKAIVSMKCSFVPKDKHVVFKKDDICVICYDNINKKKNIVKSACCDNLFCPKCTCLWVKNHTSCPMCRKQVMDVVLHLDDTSFAMMKELDTKQLTKAEQVAEIVLRNPTGKFLLFHEFKQTHSQDLEEALLLLSGKGVLWKALHRDKDRKMKQIKEGKISVVSALPETIPYGMSVPYITDIIMFCGNDEFYEKMLVAMVASAHPGDTKNIVIHRLHE